MGPESKGRAWFGKIFNKLETILVEVDTFTSQNTFCLKSSDPSVLAEDCSYGTFYLQQHNERLASPSCESPSVPPSHQNFETSGNVRAEERVEVNSLKENLSASSLPHGETLSGAPLLQDYCDGNLTSATTLGNGEPVTDHEESQTTTSLTHNFSAGEASAFPGEENVGKVRVESCRDFGSAESQFSVESSETVVESECNDDPVRAAALENSTDDSNLNPMATRIPDAPVQDNVAHMRSSSEDNPDDDVISGKSDVSPLDTNALYSIAIREDTSDVDDSALYAVRVRTKKLRSFKRKILDALTTKRRREKEYEQLAIWFGDADMGSDLVREDSECKSSQEPEPEDSQWELL